MKLLLEPSSRKHIDIYLFYFLALLIRKRGSVYYMCIVHFPCLLSSASTVSQKPNPTLCYCMMPALIAGIDSHRLPHLFTLAILHYYINTLYSLTHCQLPGVIRCSWDQVLQASPSPTLNKSFSSGSYPKQCSTTSQSLEVA